jgi:hypothetical protein
MLKNRHFFRRRRALLIPEKPRRQGSEPPINTSQPPICPC